MPYPPFDPHPLIPGGHVQTLAGNVFAGTPVPVPYDSVHVPLPDGDRLVIHINAPRMAIPADAHKPTVLLLHGLGGSSESSYIIRITKKLNARGYTAVRFNHRGCGTGSDGLARQIYHAGRVEDVDACVAHLHTMWPEKKLLLVGFSLSGNMLLRYMGERNPKRTAPNVLQALAVCPPVDLEQCSLALTRRNNWHLDRYYTTQLLKTAAARVRAFPDAPRVEFPQKMNLRLFDELYTAPQGGFKSRDAYYDASSSKHYLHAIDLPTLVLAATDDPIIPARGFEEANFSAATTVRVEKAGGHMGFIGAKTTADGDRRWMDALVLAWVEAGTPQAR